MPYNQQITEKKRKTSTLDDLFAATHHQKTALTKQEMVTQVTTDSLYNQVINRFDELAAFPQPASLSEIRKQALDAFKQTGFPSVKNEDWKYTNLQPLVNKTYQLIPGDPAQDIAASLTRVPSLGAHRVVLVNGIYQAELSTKLSDDGLTVLPIEEAFEDIAFAKHFSAYADKTGSALVSLNTALFRSGVFIQVSKNTQVKTPIHVVHLSSSTETLFTQARNLFVIGANAEVEIIESFVSDEDSADSLSNHVSEIVLEENAKLQHYYLQTAKASGHYINHTEVYQVRNSLYNNYNFTFPGASFVRNNIHVRLDDSHVESHLYGIALTADKQLVDNHTVVDHLKPHCESYEWYKNITQDTSTAVFNGKIFVREDAQKTNAFQQNNNMLIGERSAVYTKPQLEIFADDVKCSHGCTIGQFDENALFYLRARGVGEEQARVLLVHAFAFDVTSRIPNEVLREYVEALVTQGLDR